MYPHLARHERRRARSPCRSTTRAATTSRRWRARSPRPRASCSSATPTTRPRTALPPADARRLRRPSLPRHVCRDRGRGLRRVLDARRIPTSRSTCSSRHPNLVLLRTFSKVYGLCGLRVGYALGSEGFRLAVDRVRQPFSVNALAQAAAGEALRHQDEVERRVEQHGGRAASTWSPSSRSAASRRTDSEANFSWVALGDRDEDEVMRGLAERGVIVRAGTALGEEGRLRVTYGTRDGERPLPRRAGRGARRVGPVALPAQLVQRLPAVVADRHEAQQRRPPGRAGRQVCGSRCARTWLGSEYAVRVHDHAADAHPLFAAGHGLAAARATPDGPDPASQGVRARP